MAKNSKQFTAAEVAEHNTPDDAWVILHDKVYNVTKFARVHPGGKKILLDYAGKDITEIFHDLHRSEVLDKYGPRLQVGIFKGGSSLSGKRNARLSKVPYGEANFFQGWRSAIWDKSHKTFRTRVREYIAKEITPSAERENPAGKRPSAALYKKAGSVGIWALKLGPGPHLNGQSFFGVKGEDITYLHEMILHEEMIGVGCPGWVDGFGTGLVIGLPPVIHFGKPHIKKKVVAECLSGEKVICLAISEPFAGSDVANIKCTAVKSADGKHYIVNGVKKWITNGAFADYFVVAVRTGKPGMGGISLLLIERGPGLTTKAIKTSYSASAGTAYVILEDVKVPVDHLLGKENQGFKCIMYNFNHERWFIICVVIFGNRKIIEECFRWTMQRKVFGKPLIKQPVIRRKLSKMIAKNEAAYAWLENITYQMLKMSYGEQSVRLAGPISLCKMLSTDVAYFISDEACQIFGGRAITKTGMGGKLERFQRSIKFGAILGGASEVMGDLGVRMATKLYPKNAKL